MTSNVSFPSITKDFEVLNRDLGIDFICVFFVRQFSKENWINKTVLFGFIPELNHPTSQSSMSIMLMTYIKTHHPELIAAGWDTVETVKLLCTTQYKLEFTKYVPKLYDRLLLVSECHPKKFDNEKSQSNEVRKRMLECTDNKFSKNGLLMDDQKHGDALQSNELLLNVMHHLVLNDLFVDDFKNVVPNLYDRLQLYIMFITAKNYSQIDIFKLKSWMLCSPYYGSFQQLGLLPKAQEASKITDYQRAVLMFHLCNDDCFKKDFEILIEKPGHIAILKSYLAEPSFKAFEEYDGHINISGGSIVGAVATGFGARAVNRGAVVGSGASSLGWH